MANISVSVTDGNNISVEVTPVPTQVITIDRGIAGPVGPPGPAGSVTSVALTAPALFSVGGSPITGAGTLALTYSGAALPVANGGTNSTTAQAAINTLAGAVTSAQYLRGNGTNVVMSSIQTADVPTLNQNTTGTAAGLSSTLVATSGGTGQSSYAVGDLLYASTTTALAKLADVATGNALISGGVSTAPAWGKVGLTTHVSGTLPVANGGTGVTTSTGTTNVVLSNAPAITNPTFTGYTETVYSTYTTALNPANGTIQRFALTGNTTFTDSLASGQSITLMIDDGTAFTATWPTMNWVGGTAPTLATTGYTVIEIWKVSTTLYGALVGTVA